MPRQGECPECGIATGTGEYRKSCRACASRKRRSAQQRVRRYGSQSSTVTVLPEDVDEITWALSHAEGALARYRETYEQASGPAKQSRIGQKSQELAEAVQDLADALANPFAKRGKR